MPISGQIAEVVQQALLNAAAMTRSEPDNKLRSRRFVSLIGEGLRDRRTAMGCPEGHVAWKDNGRPIFGVNEFIWDVGVLRLRENTGYKSSGSVKWVTSAFLLLESELRKDAQHVMADFCKLIVGTADWKVFVGSTTYYGPPIQILTDAAATCPGNLVVCGVPEVESWDDGSGLTAQCWRYSAGEWLPINASPRDGCSI